MDTDQYISPTQQTVDDEDLELLKKLVASDEPTGNGNGKREVPWYALIPSTYNAFCPTGKGGGKDNSCGGKGGGKVSKGSVNGESVGRSAVLKKEDSWHRDGLPDSVDKFYQQRLGSVNAAEFVYRLEDALGGGGMHSESGQLLREAACVLLDRTTITEFVPKGTKRLLGKLDKDQVSNMVDALRASRELSTGYCKEHFGESFTVYRGIGGEQVSRSDIGIDGKENVIIKANVMSSWSLSKSVAEDFAKNEYGTQGRGKAEDQGKGAVISMKVKASDVLSVSDMTGLYWSLYDGHKGMEVNLGLNSSTVQVHVEKLVSTRNMLNDQIVVNDESPIEIEEEADWLHDLLKKRNQTRNAFCPTGKGGGVDPTCGKGGVSDDDFELPSTDLITPSPKGEYDSAKKRGGTKGPPRGKVSDWTPETGGSLFHGSGSSFEEFSDEPLYMTDDWNEAKGYAKGLHLGGKGSKPVVRSIQAPPGKALDADEFIMSHDDFGEGIDRAVEHAKTVGADYVYYNHPSFSSEGGDQRVVIAINPKTLKFESTGKPAAFTKTAKSSKSKVDVPAKPPAADTGTGPAIGTTWTNPSHKMASDLSGKTPDENVRSITAYHVTSRQNVERILKEGFDLKYNKHLWMNDLAVSLTPKSPKKAAMFFAARGKQMSTDKVMLEVKIKGRYTKDDSPVYGAKDAWGFNRDMIAQGLDGQDLSKMIYVHNPRSILSIKLIETPEHVGNAVSNAFCPTGKGGGVDPSCGSITTKKGEVLVPATRKQGKLLKKEVLHKPGDVIKKTVKDKKTGEKKKTETIAKGGEVQHKAVREKGVWMVNGKPAPQHVQDAGIRIDLTDVHVNLDPNADLIAQGKDAKGRTQPKYSNSHNAQAAASKFGRARELMSKRAEILKELDKDRQDPELTEQADCLRLVMKTGIRPGCKDCDTGADFESFGAVSLQGKHVKVDDDAEIYLEFVTGKSKGTTKRFPIRDPKLAGILMNRASKAGSDGDLFDTNENKLRDYSKTKDGGGFKTKDHRTALATEMAIAEIKRIGAKQTFSSKKEYRAAVDEVSEIVANAIGNTAKMCEKAYIDPTVWAGWKPFGLPTQNEIAENVFCSTGPGGGVDPTCGSGKGSIVGTSVKEFKVKGATDKEIKSIHSLESKRYSVLKKMKATDDDTLKVELKNEYDDITTKLNSVKQTIRERFKSGTTKTEPPPPKVEPPKVVPPKVVTPKVEPPKPEPPKVEPPKPEPPKTEPGDYSKMSGEELLAEIKNMSFGEKKRKAAIAGERMKLNAEFKDANRAYMKEASNTIGTEEEIRAARHAWASAEGHETYDLDTPAYKELRRLLTPKNQESVDRLKVVMNEKAKVLRDFNDESRVLTAAVGNRVKAMVKLPPEDRCKITAHIATGVSRSKADKGVREFEELVHKSALGNDTKVTIMKSVTGRAHYSGNGLVSVDGSDGSSVVVHELGHHLDNSYPAANKAANKFRLEETDGSPLLSLRKVSKGYREDEMYKEKAPGKGKWINPYMGKIYERRGFPQPTEIVSMGLEMLAKNPLELAQKDPRMFALVVNVARGRM